MPAGPDFTACAGDEHSVARSQDVSSARAEGLLFIKPASVYVIWHTCSHHFTDDERPTAHTTRTGGASACLARSHDPRHRQEVAPEFQYHCHASPTHPEKTGRIQHWGSSPHCEGTADHSGQLTRAIHEGFSCNRRHAAPTSPAVKSVAKTLSASPTRTRLNGEGQQSGGLIGERNRLERHGWNSIRALKESDPASREECLPARAADLRNLIRLSAGHTRRVVHRIA